MSFDFHPELLELKDRASDALAKAGLDLFNDYDSIDCAHEEYGLEVEGLKTRAKSYTAIRALRKLFPKWKHVTSTQYDSGFQVRISQKPTAPPKRGF